MAVRDAGAVQRLPGPAQRFAESTPSLIGPITLDMKHAGERSAVTPHAPFDVAGAGNEARVAGLRASAKALESPPEPNVGAPVLDPTPDLLLKMDAQTNFSEILLARRAR